MKSIYSPSYRALLAWLRASRIEKGLSLRDVGQKMGTTHTWVGKVETGERRLDVTEYVRLCQNIGVAPSHGLAIVEAATPAYPSMAAIPLPQVAEQHKPHAAASQNAKPKGAYKVPRQGKRRL